MSASERILEIEGTIDSHNHLILDSQEIPIDGPQRVKVVIKPIPGKGSLKAIGHLRGKWIDDPVDSLEFQREMRSEWDNRQ